MQAVFGGMALTLDFRSCRSMQYKILLYHVYRQLYLLDLTEPGILKYLLQAQQLADLLLD